MRDISDEESKSLWHKMAEVLQEVDERDRDVFLNLCVKQGIRCNNTGFTGPSSSFQWRSYDITPVRKERFWRTYTCVMNRDIIQCPVDGAWSSWSPWSRCNATCDAQGTQTRSRTCSNPVPVKGGIRCEGSLLRSRPCLGACQDPSRDGGILGAEAFLKQVHAAFPDLKNKCYDAYCTFGIVQHALKQELVKIKYWSSLKCVKYGGACPVDGKWSVWSAWSECSLKCGSGSSTRTRTCDSPQPAFGGHPCPGPSHELQSCVKRECGTTTSETFTEWTTWSPCSVSCGSYGVQSATRVCLRKVGCDLHGVLTPYINRSRPCFMDDCPTQGGWSDWSDWTRCTAACGTGRQSRARLCDSPYPAGGLDCEGNALQFRLCKGDVCAGQPNAREVADGWHRRGKNKHRAYDNEDVEIDDKDEYSQGPIDPSLESLYTPWTRWTPCTVSCGQGTRWRLRWCASSKAPLPPCEGEVRQVQTCNNFVCPVPGGWGVWLSWTPCSRTCGTGKRQRYRQCSNPLPQLGGACNGDSKRLEACDMGPCPRLATGTWMAWNAWSTCSKTCGAGKRTRVRIRRHYQGGGWIHRSASSALATPVLTAESASEDNGTKEVLDCNTQSCPVDGHWAEWGEWSRCSAVCGFGRRARDRTCTDPAPIFGGRACGGSGTDLAHCFAGPCPDATDRAVRLGPGSWIRFAPRNHPTRFLAIYVHFKPLSPSGALLRRYRQCHSVFDDDAEKGGEEDKANEQEDRRADQDERCRLVVEISLEQGQVRLVVQARGARLILQSPVVLSLDAWHELLVEVLKSGASLRVNDHARLNASFSRHLIKDLDFDSYMTIGARDNKTAGLVCSICSLSVNFRMQDLFASADWEGLGTHVGHHAVSVHSIDPSVRLSHFHGLYYSPLRLPYTTRLSVRMTMALDKEDGLVLYSRGHEPGTLVSLGLRRSRMLLCMVCIPARGNICHQGDELVLHQWYHIALEATGAEAEVRVDHGQALQLTCKGLPFRPAAVLFVGGRSPSAWPQTQKVTNYTEGFYGVVGAMEVNGRNVPFRQAVLLSRKDQINPDGYSRATRITPVFAPKTSIVTLHCEIDRPADPSQEVRVIWLLRDSVLEPTDFIQINKPVGLDKLVGTLQLEPGGHTEGIYSCVVSRDRLLELHHVFPVLRHSTRLSFNESNVEWIFLDVLLAFLPLFVMGCVVYKFRHKSLLSRRQKRLQLQKALLQSIEPKGQLRKFQWRPVGGKGKDGSDIHKTRVVSFSGTSQFREPRLTERSGQSSNLATATASQAIRQPASNAPVATAERLAHDVDKFDPAQESTVTAYVQWRSTGEEPIPFSPRSGSAESESDNVGVPEMVSHVDVVDGYSFVSTQTDSELDFDPAMTGQPGSGASFHGDSCQDPKRVLMAPGPQQSDIHGNVTYYQNSHLYSNLADEADAAVLSAASGEHPRTPETNVSYNKTPSFTQHPYCQHQHHLQHHRQYQKATSWCQSPKKLVRKRPSSEGRHMPLCKRRQAELIGPEDARRRHCSRDCHSQSRSKDSHYSNICADSLWKEASLDKAKRRLTARRHGSDVYYENNRASTLTEKKTGRKRSVRARGQNAELRQLRAGGNDSVLRQSQSGCDIY